VGGGNGWGTGRTEVGINPITGERGGFQAEDRNGSGRFVLLSSDRYIDGVFVPEGSSPQVVSSRGHVFSECPPTNNIFFAEIISGSASQIGLWLNGRATTQLAGRTYGTAEYPALFMHANLGIPFDLNAIREDLPKGTLARFTADAGLSSDISRPGNAEVWVLVDGQVRFRAAVNDPQQAVSLDVSLQKTDRFLTLMATDGGDEDQPGVASGRATDSDWCVFAMPSLELEFSD
jgi:hypothetical protein